MPQPTSSFSTSRQIIRIPGSYGKSLHPVSVSLASRIVFSVSSVTFRDDEHDVSDEEEGEGRINFSVDHKENERAKVVEAFLEEQKRGILSHLPAINRLHIGCRDNGLFKFTLIYATIDYDLHAFPTTILIDA